MRFFESEVVQKQDDAYDEERFWPRFRCKVPAQLSDETGAKWDCDIVDVSESGYRIVTTAKLKRGTVVNIDIEPAVKASVVWVRKNRAGLKVSD